MTNKENEPLEMVNGNSGNFFEDYKLQHSDIANESLSTPSRNASPTRNPLFAQNVACSPSKDTKSSVITPRKLNSSTKVIESLHGEIDALKLEILKVKSNNEELKKSHDLVKKRRDQLMEQLSNTKHENETVNSLLQRKQRRINDLEEQLNEITSTNDDLKFEFQSLQVRSEKLRQSEASSVSEFERMKIAYETMVTSQKEYRDHYSKEIKILKDRLNEFIKNKDEMLNRNITLISKSDATLIKSIKAVTNKSKVLEKTYEARDSRFTQRLENIAANNRKNSNEVTFLLQTSKDLFHEIASKFEIDKEELLRTYLEQDHSRIDPFEESEDTIEAKKKTYSPPSLHVRKRNEKRTTVSRSSSASSGGRVPSIEERVISLDKELNRSIPLKNRITSNNNNNNNSSSSLGRSRSFKNQRNSSYNTNGNSNASNNNKSLFSKITPSDTRRVQDKKNNDDNKSSSRNNSRRSSKIVDLNSVPNQFFSDHETAPDIIDTAEGGDGTDVTAPPKRRRRRRRRRRGKKNNTGEIEGQQSGHEDGDNDDYSDDPDTSVVESDVDTKIEEKKSEKKKDTTDVLNEIKEEGEEKKEVIEEELQNTQGEEVQEADDVKKSGAEVEDTTHA